MDAGIDYLRVAMALLFVIGLIFFSALLVKKTGLDRRLGGGKGAGRLKIVETLYLDPRHRLVIVRQDDREHTILLGGAGDTLISSTPAKDSDAA